MEPMTARARIAVLLTASAVVLAGCGDDSTAADPTPASGSTKHPGTEHTDTQQSESSAPSGAAATSPPAGGTVTVPVYFVGDTPQGPKLYREFRTVGSENPEMEALALMTAGDALDPDYDTVYPRGSFVGVEVGSDSIHVALPDESWTSPDTMSEADARMAGQQLVYTLQGIAQSRLPVEIELDGAPADLFGLGGQLGNEPELDVRALVNVTTPEQGAPVSGSFTATGVASSFEATVPWEVRQGDTVVKKGFSTAEGWMDKLYPWQAEVDVSGLEPGEYTFVALTDDPSGGEGGGPTEDSKTITVR
jgi:Immunoglobulin-like domain of bacterial spore germination/Sporulation and spore germination